MEDNLDSFIMKDWERSMGFFSHEEVMPSELAGEAPTFEKIVDKGTQLSKEMGKGAVGALMPGEWERLGKALVYAVAPDADESRVDAFLRGIEEDPAMYSADDFYELVGETEGPLSEEAKQVGQVMGSLFAPGGIIAGLAKKGKALAKPAAMATAIGATAASPAAQGAQGIYNNPGNVEATEGWAGDTGERYGENDRFAVFDSPEMGLRALMRDVRTKIKDSKGSIKQMITKYAPPNENPTDEYIAYVEKAVGKKKAALKDAPAITKAILEFENKPKLREYYLNDPKIFETAAKLSTRGFKAGTTFEQAKSQMGIK